MPVLLLNKALKKAGRAYTTARPVIAKFLLFVIPRRKRRGMLIRSKTIIKWLDCNIIF